MPPYTNLRWEKALEGWDLFAVDEEFNLPSISLLGWVYKNHGKGTWVGWAYGIDYTSDIQNEFDNLEDAQAWVVACVRMG
jgi:hypothetical protein